MNFYQKEYYSVNYPVGLNRGGLVVLKAHVGKVTLK